MSRAEWAAAMIAKLGDNGEHWGKGAFALDVHGSRCNLDGEWVHRWCLVGAIRCLPPDENYRLFCQTITVSCLVEWNDYPARTWPEVKAALLAYGESEK